MDDQFHACSLLLSVGPRIYTKTCLYANTLDDDLVVSQLPGFPQVSLTVGCTPEISQLIRVKITFDLTATGGHGYKWASFIGLVLSQFALIGKTTFPVEGLDVTRPGAGLRKLDKKAAL